MVMAADGGVLDSRYRLERLVGSGEFGEVWLGADQILARPVTIKLLGGDVADADMLDRFRAEARLASSITHRNLARVFDYNDPVDGQPPFLVMEFVQGQSLADQLAGGPLSVPATLDVLAQVAAGVGAANEAGLVRLDVTPASVLLSSDGVVKVTDFGIGSTSDTAAGLYALGSLARECLRGPAEVPAAVAALIADLTDEDAANRPGSAAEVAERATALREQLAPRRILTGPLAALAESVRRPAERGQAPSASATAPLGEGSRRRPWTRLVLAPVAAAIVVASVLFLVGRLDKSIDPAQSDIRAGNRTALVNGAAFRNRSVSVADTRLRRLGFSVRNRWQRSATVPAGLVIAVSPTGRLPIGSVVTVLGSGSAVGAGHGMTRTPGSRHHRRGRQTPTHSPTSKASPSPKGGSSPSPQPTSTPSPSPTGTPSPAPSQTPTSSPTSNPTPSGSPTGPGVPSPSGSASPSAAGTGMAR
jgi:eukaryotic-like serine/threonine-protein kinase